MSFTPEELALIPEDKREEANDMLTAIELCVYSDHPREGVNILLENLLARGQDKVITLAMLTGNASTTTIKMMASMILAMLSARTTELRLMRDKDGKGGDANT